MGGCWVGEVFKIEVGVTVGAGLGCGEGEFSSGGAGWINEETRRIPNVSEGAIGVGVGEHVLACTFEGGENVELTLSVNMDTCCVCHNDLAEQRGIRVLKGMEGEATVVVPRL